MTEVQEASEMPQVGMAPFAMVPSAEVDQAQQGGAYVLTQPIAEEPASPFAFLGGFAGGLAAGAALVFSLVKRTGEKVSAEAATIFNGAEDRHELGMPRGRAGVPTMMAQPKEGGLGMSDEMIG